MDSPSLVLFQNTPNIAPQFFYFLKRFFVETNRCINFKELLIPQETWDFGLSTRRIAYFCYYYT